MKLIIRKLFLGLFFSSVLFFTNISASGGETSCEAKTGRPIFDPKNGIGNFELHLYDEKMKENPDVEKILVLNHLISARKIILEKINKKEFLFSGKTEKSEVSTNEINDIAEDISETKIEASKKWHKGGGRNSARSFERDMYSGKKTIFYAELKITNDDSSIMKFYSVSGKIKITESESDLNNRIYFPGYDFKQGERLFIPKVAKRNDSLDGSVQEGHLRDTDSDYFTLERVGQITKDQENIKTGKLDIFVSRPMCDSCKDVLRQFREVRPNITVKVHELELPKIISIPSDQMI